MNDTKYIGMDVHQATISVAVRDSRGNLGMEAILETIEIMSDRNAMKTIREYEAGKLKLKEFSPNEI